MAVLTGCATAPSPESPREYLDERSAATISVVGKPIVFARARRELAAYSRDYVTIAAAAVDRTGKVDYVLIAYFWSTVDPRNKAPSATPAFDPLVLTADDRRIRFPLRDHSAEDAGVGIPVHAPEGGAAQPSVYPTDLGTLRFIAQARHLSVLSGTDELPVSYDLWDDQRGSLGALVKLLSGEK